VGTQAIATLIAVYGLFMTPLGWRWAGFVWAYAIAWFLINDRVKLLAYRIFDPTKAPLLANKPVDLNPQIAQRAYELYEQRGRRDGQADQDWLKAEREVKAEPKPEAKAEPKPEAKAEPKREGNAESKPEAKAEPKPESKAEPKREGNAESKPEAKAEPKPDAKTEPKPDAKAEPKPDAKTESKPEAKAEPKPDAKTEPKPEAKAEPKPDAKAEPKPEAKAETPSDLTPGIVKRVHELYEELGREDVREVQDWEKAQREIRKDKPNK
jgi:hypothetical protein